ncbi:MAG: hypothetical protein KAU38_17715 [Desulfobacterales bacterium]|jgi:hypothetical protein|nr:hypothetical protein [Desulfobacterales bacterium]
MAKENDSKSKNKETNRDRFVKIIERRVNITLKNLDSIGKCSNRKNYEYSDEDVRKIFSEIEKKSKQVKSMFRGLKNDNKFKLK